MQKDEGSLPLQILVKLLKWKSANSLGAVWTRMGLSDKNPLSSQPLGLCLPSFPQSRGALLEDRGIWQGFTN